MYTVQDVMTREVVTLVEEDDLGLADNIMHFGRFRHLPVVREGKVVGLVTQRDYLRALAERGPSRTQTVLARDVMTRDVHSVRPDSNLRGALQLMLRHKYGCLPVVTRRGELVGILTESDATRFAARMVADLEQVERTMARAVPRA